MTDPLVPDPDDPGAPLERHDIPDDEPLPGDEVSHDDPDPDVPENPEDKDEDDPGEDDAAGTGASGRSEDRLVWWLPRRQPAP